MVNSLGIFKALHHFLLQLRVGNLGADGNATLDGLLDLSDQGHQLGRRIYVLGGHATLSSVEGRDLEDPMRLLDMLDLYLSLQVDPGDGL